MIYSELNQEQKKEVKAGFLMGTLQLNISWGDLANIDNIVTDELMEMFHENTNFSPDDFTGEEDI